MTYEELVIYASSIGLDVREKPLLANSGRIKGNRIAIRRRMTSTEKACILAEELGHYYTTDGDILDPSKVENRKQELHARLWGYNHQLGLLGIIQAYKARRTTPDEMAEFLNITPAYLQEALVCYRSKYGTHVELDNYIIFFEPCLTVMEILK